MNPEDESPEPRPLQRRATADYMRIAGQRSVVYGLVEFDVTDAREVIQNRFEETGERLSFTAFLVGCLGRAIDDHPDVNAYHDWRGRVVRFDDVDVNVLVEKHVDGEKLAIPHVVRRANRRSVVSIHEEIRRVQTSPAESRHSSLASLGLRLPGIVRRQIWRLPQVSPVHWKRLAGTVAVTSVGMFGDGSGWGVSPSNYTCQVIVGGIATKPTVVDGEIVPQEKLSVTVSFDHDVVDGAPAARFTDRLRGLVETSYGLDEHS
ncbi:2-oxo acid dehydrogenase subunit E2 [Halomarina rubra]|uniref:2-oxo acid dehydrogenase subunit E2 n=1 Tax=Halomarina rubra TaxID=2071873 RepID=A0ABD6AU40_9EURY|nr:2-oxo acid dehydrogenase subunit E2 [Halomarina rubra]